MSSACLLQAYFAAKILVSRFAAKTGPVLRALWLQSGMPKSCRESGSKASQGAVA
jgi:hypothetical protein